MEGGLEAKIHEGGKLHLKFIFFPFSISLRLSRVVFVGHTVST